MIPLRAKLKALDQLHLLEQWERLEPTQRAALAEQIDQLNVAQIRQLQARLKVATQPPSPYSPLQSWTFWNRPEERNLGEEALRQGRVGCLIVAGGQGSRLRCSGPKGMVVVNGKSLFQIFAEKTLVASQVYGKPLSLAFMVSPHYQAAVIEFFADRDFFGLEPHQLSFFAQSTLPLLDQEGNLFLETPWRIAASPDGNGGALKYLYEAGIWQQWQGKGIRHLQFVHIDNPLSDPFDPSLLGLQIRLGHEVTIQAVERIDASEKVGVIVQEKGQPRVVEYSEITPEACQERSSEGAFLHRCANISRFCFSMEFVHRFAIQGFCQMPLHLVRKAVMRLGSHELPSQPNAWKFERFIFDLLPQAQSAGVCLAPRAACYAPLKNAAGPDSLATVEQALKQQSAYS